MSRTTDVARHCALANAPSTDDRQLRGDDHNVRAAAADHAEIGQGNRRSFALLGRNRPCLGVGKHRVKPCPQLARAALAHVAQDRHDEAAFCVDGDAKGDTLVKAALPGSRNGTDEADGRALSDRPIADIGLIAGLRPWLREPASPGVPR
jgi:hypothetical protein